MSIFSRVLQHLIFQWSEPPISELILFICGDIAVVLQQKGQAERLKLQTSRSLAGVKHINDVETEVSLKPQDIHVRTVQNFENLRV